MAYEAAPDRVKGDHVAVAFAGPAHGPQTVEDGRFDEDEALAAPALRRPRRQGPIGETRQRERDMILPDGTTHAGRTPAHWRRGALIVAKRTGHKVGLDAATRMAKDADFRPIKNPAIRSRAPLPRRFAPWTN